MSIDKIILKIYLDLDFLSPDGFSQINILNEYFGRVHTIQSSFTVMRPTEYNSSPGFPNTFFCYGSLYSTHESD